MALDTLVAELEQELTTAMQAFVRGTVDKTRKHFQLMVKMVDEERARGDTELAAKRAALEAELARVQVVQQTQEEVVTLDVGGVHFSSSLATLRSKPGSMLSALLSGRYLVDKTDSGRVCARSLILLLCF